MEDSFAFSWCGLSLYFGRRITTDLEKRAYRRQSDHQSSAEHSSWLHLKFGKWTRTRGDKGPLDLTPVLIPPLQNLTSEWDEKTEESQILFSRQVKSTSQLRQIPERNWRPVYLDTVTHTSFVCWSELSWRVFWHIIVESLFFWTLW